MGMICFEMLLVIGYNRVPAPPAKIIPFMVFFLTNQFLKNYTKIGFGISFTKL